MPNIPRRYLDAPATVAVDKTAIRKTLLKRYVDVAFTKEDLIMCSTKLGTGVGLGVGDYFAAGLPTLIGKSIETSVMAGVRGARRAQAKQMFANIDALSASQAQVLVVEAAKLVEPGFDWMKNKLAVSAASGASAAAASSAGAAAASVGTVVGEVFQDYIQDAIFDQLFAIAPFGIGAAKTTAQMSLKVTELKMRIDNLKKQIAALQAQAA